MNFTVARETWRCGSGDFKEPDVGIGKGKTRLLNVEGFMCPLGNAALQLGADKEDILDRMTPLSADHQKKLSPILLKPNPLMEGWLLTELSIEAAKVNDEYNFNAKDNSWREAELKKIFAKHGHTIEFTGAHPN